MVFVSVLGLGYVASLNILPAFSRVYQNFWSLLSESAPALLCGYTLAGVVTAYFYTQQDMGLNQGSRVKQAVRGMIYGLPLPICSCGVLPIYESFIRSGVSPTAAMAFFVATPELGLDAILLSFPMLGGTLAIVRVVLAVVVALLVSLLVARHLSARPVQKKPLQQASYSHRLSTALKFGLGTYLIIRCLGF